MLGGIDLWFVTSALFPGVAVLFKCSLCTRRQMGAQKTTKQTQNAILSSVITAISRTNDGFRCVIKEQAQKVTPPARVQMYRGRDGTPPSQAGVPSEEQTAAYMPSGCPQELWQPPLNLPLTSAGSGFEQRRKENAALVTVVTDSLADRSQNGRVSLGEVHHSQHFIAVS